MNRLDIDAINQHSPYDVYAEDDQYPQFDSIISRFDSEIAIFNEFKP